MWPEGEEGEKGTEASEGPQEVKGAGEEKPQKDAGLVRVSGGGKTLTGRRRWVLGLLWRMHS